MTFSVSVHHHRITVSIIIIVLAWNGNFLSSIVQAFVFRNLLPNSFDSVFCQIRKWNFWPTFGHLAIEWLRNRHTTIRAPAVGLHLSFWQKPEFPIHLERVPISYSVLVVIHTSLASDRVVCFIAMISGAFRFSHMFEHFSSIHKLHERFIVLLSLPPPFSLSPSLSIQFHDVIAIPMGHVLCARVCTHSFIHGTYRSRASLRPVIRFVSGDEAILSICKHFVI